MGRLSLKVVPGSSRDEIVGWLGDSLKVKVKALPEKGRANEAVVALLAERLGIVSAHHRHEVRGADQGGQGLISPSWRSAVAPA